MLERIAREIGVGPTQVKAVAKLLDEGSTVPFIARYRKEAHGNLDEVQIGKIQDRLAYYRELDERKKTILKSIDEQGKLTDELKSDSRDVREERARRPLPALQAQASHPRRCRARKGL